MPALARSLCKGEHSFSGQVLWVMVEEGVVGDGNEKLNVHVALLLSPAISPDEVSEVSGHTDEFAHSEFTVAPFFCGNHRCRDQLETEGAIVELRDCEGIPVD